MPALRVSARARAALDAIGEYTLRIWGQEQAILYLDRLEDCMLQLARNPLLGRACDEILPGVRRMEEGRHVIFYRAKRSGILIQRILHQSMIPPGRIQ